MKINLLIVLVFSLSNVNAGDPEADMTVEQVVAYHGYPIETHDVITDDGYILTLHRIPYGKNSTSTSGRKPIILQHGVLANSGYWIADIATKNLPYLLADRGYDVFLPNFRGNNLALRHLTLSPEDKAFWNFTFNECADHDLPAIFDTVLQLNGAEKFTYVAHSMGTTAMFIYLSKKPGYDKVTSFHALGPVAQVKNSPSPVVQTLVIFADGVYGLLNFFGEYDFLSNGTDIEFLADTVCFWPTNIICSNAIFLVMGFDQKEFNNSRLPVFMNFFPAGTSTKTMFHFGQVAKAGKFQEYDYGQAGNLEMYNQTTPPLYNVSRITRPVYMYSGLNDWLADPKDVAWLVANLNTLQEHFVVNYTKFNHADFAWSKDVMSMLYYHLLENIDASSS